MRALLMIALAAASLAGCKEEPRKPGDNGDSFIKKNPPKTICVVDDYRGDVVAKKCALGQKVAYLPSRWGNEQLPVMFAAVNCDLTKSVVQTNGGVTCIYDPIKLQTPEEAKAEEARAAAAAPASGVVPKADAQ